MSDVEKTNILVVDDRPDKLMALDVILSPLQQNVIKAQSGEAALRLMLQHDFAVILLDVNMPGMDGFEIASLVREAERTKDIPIIFVSALEPSDERVQRAYSLGAVDYVPSPGAPEVLRAKVSVFVELHLKNRHLLRISQELQTRNQQLQNYCYAMAHDLRAPLRAQRHFSQILLEDCAAKMDENEKDLLTRIFRSAARMDALVVDLMQFIRIEHINLPVEKLDLNETVAAALNYLEDEIRITGTTVNLNEPLLQLTGHKATVIQIVVNLVCNAITFVAEGKKPAIQISSEAYRNKVRVSVQDNGIGIDSEHRNKVFDLFERLQPSKHLEGTGVGLAIVKTGIERMNGKVGVESESGKGSTFWFELPA